MGVVNPCEPESPRNGHYCQLNECSFGPGGTLYIDIQATKVAHGTSQIHRSMPLDLRDEVILTPEGVHR